MNGVFRYKVLPKLKLILQVYYDVHITKEEVIRNRYVLKKDPKFDATFNQIVHLHNSELDIYGEETEEFAEHIARYKYIYDYKDAALIVSEKNQALKGVLLRAKVMEETWLNYHICATLDEAVKRMGYTEELKTIYDEYDKLMEGVIKENVVTL